MILVDSDVLIEHLRGRTPARDWLVQARQSSGPLAISVVSLTEIAGGMRPPERREVIRLLGSMQRFEVTEQVAWRAATLMQEYRRSHSGIGLGDYPRTRQGRKFRSSYVAGAGGSVSAAMHAVSRRRI